MVKRPFKFLPQYCSNPHNMLPKRILQCQVAKCANINQIQQVLEVEIAVFFSLIPRGYQKRAKKARINNRLNQQSG